MRLITDALLIIGVAALSACAEDGDEEAVGKFRGIQFHFRCGLNVPRLFCVHHVRLTRPTGERNGGPLMFHLAHAYIRVRAHTTARTQREQQREIVARGRWVGVVGCCDGVPRPVVNHVVLLRLALGANVVRQPDHRRRPPSFVQSATYSRVGTNACSRRGTSAATNVVHYN